MELVSQEGAPATMAGSHRFIINLTAKKDHTAEVRACEVIGAHHRNRFTFPSKVNIEDVFIDHVADEINNCLSSLSRTTEVVSLPTVTIETPGLTLAKAHLMTTLSEDGTLGIILRFKVVLGGISLAFRPELGIEDSVADHTSHMSALVLTDIVMPLLDLCAGAEAGVLVNSKAFDDFMDTLIERSTDVRFQAELIKRFVAQAGQPQAAPRRSAVGRPRIELVSPR